MKLNITAHTTPLLELYSLFARYLSVRVVCAEKVCHKCTDNPVDMLSGALWRTSVRSGETQKTITPFFFFLSQGSNTGLVPQGLREHVRPVAHPTSRLFRSTRGRPRDESMTRAQRRRKASLYISRRSQRFPESPSPDETRQPPRAAAPKRELRRARFAFDVEARPREPYKDGGWNGRFFCPQFLFGRDHLPTTVLFRVKMSDAVFRGPPNFRGDAK